MRAVVSNHCWRWLMGGAVAVSLLAFFLLIALLGWQGLRYFWPQPVTLFTLQQSGKTVRLLGEVSHSQTVSRQQLEASGADFPAPLPDEVTRYLVKTGNRGLAGIDFHSVLSSEIVQRQRPTGIIAVQRRAGGMAYGWFDGLLENGQPLAAENMMRVLQQRIRQAREHQSQADTIRRVNMARLNNELDQLATQRQQLLQANQYNAQAQSIHQADSAALKRQYSQQAQRLSELNSESESTVLILRDVQGRRHAIPLSQILAAWYPNTLSDSQKWRHFGFQLWHFVNDSSGDSGVLPAIFGTVLMVLLMSIVVMPLGVIAAIWLHEYAGNSLMTRLVRIAVINLAGVPSIVYGIFGLGFFVWLMGGTLDRLLFSDVLPAPTFGTPGLLWASLTLALLTLPVVIVATEEGLSRIPPSLRQGSLALGATHAETLWHVTLPLAVPAMLTGLILAVARAAGETAPLMLVGVVKMAPDLPVDSIFPYLHLDRKFMHLGFRIYDLAFQSPDVQADRPLVFATALLLVIIILGLNLVAMGLRHRLRERYRVLMN